MKAEKLTYRDTRNYTPIDVIKGVDQTTRKIVMADDPAPAKAERMPKCKFCKKYTPGDQESLGTCGAMKDDFFAYGDMVAVTCGMYEEKKN